MNAVLHNLQPLCPLLCNRRIVLDTLDAFASRHALLLYVVVSLRLDSFWKMYFEPSKLF